MKTRNSLISLAVAIVAAVGLGASASGALLSPRAAGNAIIHTADKNNDVNLVAAGLTSNEYAAPRLAGNNVATAPGVNTTVNPSTLCSARMTASPKAIQACAALPSQSMPCCNVTAR